MKRITRIVLATCGVVVAVLGFIGIFVPVLPTTPLLLLAAFLLSRSSERLNTWLRGTKAYRSFVEPFRQTGGITKGKKASILIASYTVLGISAFLVQRWYVWLILAAVAVWLFYLMVIRIPTVSAEVDRTAKEAVDARLAQEEREQVERALETMVSDREEEL